jgi:hypothetical protein
MVDSGKRRAAAQDKEVGKIRQSKGIQESKEVLAII